MTERSGDRDRFEGAVDEMEGKAKQAWGDLSDDDRLKAEGMLEEAKGKAQGFLGDIKEKVEDFKDDIERAAN